MTMTKFIVGVIIGHIFFYIFNECIQPYNLFFWLCEIMALGYLLTMFFLRRMSKYWIVFNQWLVPAVAMFCVFQLPIFIQMCLWGKDIVIILFYAHVYRLTLVIEIPVVYYISNKIEEHLTKLLLKE